MAGPRATGAGGLGALAILATLLAAAAAERATPECAVEAGAPVFADPLDRVGPGLPSDFVEGEGATIFAGGFRVGYEEDYKVVTNGLAGGATVVLYQCGTTPPVGGLAENSTALFSVPLESTAVASTSLLPFLRILGVEDRIKYYPEYATAPCVQKLVGCEGADRTMTPSWANATLYAAQAAEVEAVFADYADAPNAVAFSSFADAGLLERAEWVKYLAPFFNKEREAEAFFREQVEAFDAAKAAAAAAAPGGAAPVAPPPTVAWAAKREYYSDEYPEAVVVSFANYKRELTTAANAAILDPSFFSFLEFSDPSLPDLNGTAGVTVTEDQVEFVLTDANRDDMMDLVHGLLELADVIVDETYAFDPASYGLANFTAAFELDGDPAGFPALADGAVLRVDGRVTPTGGLDWFESAPAYPAELLQDFVHALWGDQGAPGEPVHVPMWFRNIAAGEEPQVIGPELCAVPMCAEEYKYICRSWNGPTCEE